MDERHIPIEQMEFYQEYVKLADDIWKAVTQWNSFDKDTLGKQWVRAADSIGANLVEGDGRYSKGDGIHFLVIARASARETRYWLERAQERKLLSDSQAERWLSVLTAATKRLNGLISYRRSHPTAPQIRETEELYETEPNTQHPTPNTQHPTPNTGV